MTTPPSPGDPLALPHWMAAAEGRLAMQRCDACGHVRWPAARACPACLTEGGGWATLSGRGELWTFAVYPHALHPAFAGEVPYAAGLVRLDEGPTLYARIDGDPAALACGIRLRAVFPAPVAGVAVPRFRPEENDDR